MGGLRLRAVVRSVMQVGAVAMRTCSLRIATRHGVAVEANHVAVIGRLVDREVGAEQLRAAGQHGVAPRGVVVLRFFQVRIGTRSGQPALLGASIKLFDTTPAIARALATHTGGRLLYASATDGSAMIGYDSAMTALDNCRQLQGSHGVGAIKPEVIVPAARPL